MLGLIVFSSIFHELMTTSWMNSWDLESNFRRMIEYVKLVLLIWIMTCHSWSVWVSTDRLVDPLIFRKQLVLRITWWTHYRDSFVTLSICNTKYDMTLLLFGHRMTFVSNTIHLSLTRPSINFNCFSKLLIEYVIPYLLKFIRYDWQYDSRYTFSFFDKFMRLERSFFYNKFNLDRLSSFNDCRFLFFVIRSELDQSYIHVQKLT